MKLESKNILLVSPEPWDHIFVSKHHYAVNLSKRGNKVYFLNPPKSSTGIANTNYPDVFSVNYSGFLRGLRYYPVFLRKRLIRKKFLMLQRLCDLEFDIIWSFDNSVFFDFSALPSGLLKLSHIVDLNQNFETECAASTADYCFCTTEIIKSRLQLYNRKTFKINHGFNFDALNGKRERLPGSNKIKVAYAGNLAMRYIDWILIAKLVKDNPEADFVFVGPNASEPDRDASQNDAKNSVRGSDNTYFLGKLDSWRLIEVLNSADILLVSYQEKYHKDQANPHKMMEYLGCGKMIVATFTEEYHFLAEDNLFLMSKSNAESPGLFRLAVADLERWNAKSLIQKRRMFAESNSYDAQIRRIEHIIRNE